MGQLLWTLILAAILIIPLWRICGRAGFSPWWALLSIVPVVNIVMLWVFAYAKWPILGGDKASNQ